MSSFLQQVETGSGEVRDIESCLHFFIVKNRLRGGSSPDTPSASRCLRLLRDHEASSHGLLPLGPSHEGLLARYVCVMFFLCYVF